MQSFGNMEPHQIQPMNHNQYPINPTIYRYPVEDQWNPNLEPQDYRYPAEGEWKTVVNRRQQRNKYSENNFTNSIEKPYRPSIYKQW